MHVKKKEKISPRPLRDGVILGFVAWLKSLQVGPHVVSMPDYFGGLDGDIWASIFQ